MANQRLDHTFVFSFSYSQAHHFCKTRRVVANFDTMVGLVCVQRLLCEEVGTTLLGVLDLSTLGVLSERD